MFLLLSIAMMWLMIFGVGCFYYGMLPKHLTDHIISITTSALFSATLAWLLIGYPVAFGQQNPLFDPNTTVDTLLNVLFQLCFCLYAVVMVIGAVIDRLSIKHAIVLSFVWVIVVYTPLVNWFWTSEGFLAKLGALDFSGGMVVHLSAGISSYVLAYLLHQKTDSPAQNRNEWLYLGMIFITVGWFFFNAGPVGELNQAAAHIMIKTLLALISGGFVWAMLSYYHDKTVETTALLNGTIVGLVTSTASVGYTPLLPFIGIIICSSALTFIAIRHWLTKLPVSDVVDSFGMNGIGGALGAIGCAIAFPQAMIGQIFGLLMTTILSLCVTYVLGKLLFNHSKKA